jgi:NAD-dependent deacetylase sirtuin 5
LYDVKCSNFFCDYREKNNFRDPIVPALELPTDESDPTTNDVRTARATNGTVRAPVARELDISDAAVALPDIPENALPHCPQCSNLLRPGVVWFGEALPSQVLDAVDSFIEDERGIDVMLVIGTSARVFPAAGYIEEARAAGARIAVINTEMDLPPGSLEEGDWFFQGDAAIVLPALLEPIIGNIDSLSEVKL